MVALPGDVSNVAALVSSFWTWVALCFRGSGACIQCRMRPLLRLLRALVCGYGFMGKDCAYPSVVLVLVCSLPDVGMRMRFMGMFSLVFPWSWCSCVQCHGDSSVAVFAGGRCPCSVLSCSDRGDSTGAVLGSVDDVPVVVQRQVQGQTAH